MTYEYKVFAICKARWEVDSHFCNCEFCTFSSDETEEYPYPEDLVNCEVTESFTDYFDNKTEYGLTGDETTFVYRDNNLFVETVYQGTRLLSHDEMQKLLEYTQGQWSDGIGEGYEQWPQEVNIDEVFISMWYSGQKAHIAWRFIE